MTNAAGKHLVFCVLIASITFLSIEAGSQILFFAQKGRFLFQRRPSEEFHIRDFSVLTNDARGFTAIPNYTNPNYAGFFLSFDAFGFRRGKQTASSSGQRNIVFLGDSVPFGWGVPDNSSLPSQFFERLQANSMSFGVVNAALPSYALAQAVARYEHEIHGQMAVDTVYVQIYDPAVQLAVRGSHWQPSDNWMNYPYISKSFLSRHSAAIAIGERFVSLLNIHWRGAESEVETFDPYDTATTKRVHVHVWAELERLLAMSKTDNVRCLIVAPVTIPTQSLDNGHYSRSRLAAIELVNQNLRDFAGSHNHDIIFADTISLLRRYPDADVFIDGCCHLSEHGNGIVADYLMTLLLNSGHFVQNRSRQDPGEGRARLVPLESFENQPLDPPPATLTPRATPASSTTLIPQATPTPPATLMGRAFKSCNELKAEIQAKLDAKGITGYALTILAHVDLQRQHIIGSCEGNTKKIALDRSCSAQRLDCRAERGRHSDRGHQSAEKM